MQKPTWLNKANIKITLDARPILAAGEHPIEQVLREAGNLNSGEIYEIITLFHPVPMIEKLAALGFESFSEQEESGRYCTYFRIRHTQSQ
jgi:uncharacterized protein (DUF2249 family)